LTTTEAEYVAAIKACKERILLKDFMKEFGKEQVCPHFTVIVRVL